MARTCDSGNTHRRGVAALTLVVLLALLAIAVVGITLGGARDQDLTIARMNTLRAMYACEAGTNMAIREIMVDSDEDGDGTVGSISDDGLSANDPTVGGGRMIVTASVSDTTATLTSRGRAGDSVRQAVTVMEIGQRASAMIAYGRMGAGSAPAYRLWDGSAWGAEQSANSIGSDVQWLRLAGSPLSGAYVMAVLDNDSDIEIQVYDGSTWGSVLQATNDAGTTSSRVFDVAYEQLSGEALLVYRESGTSDVRYRTYDGSAWSGEATHSITANNLAWLRLIPKPGSDEIMLVAQSSDSTNHTRAVVWNGSVFTNLSPTSSTSGYSASDHADMAIESTSGQGLFVFTQGGNNPGYRTLTSATWSNTTNAPSVGGASEWIKLAPSPVNDTIVMASQDVNSDINVNVWYGAGWGTNLEVETSTASTSRRAMDVAFEPGGSRALVAYDENSHTLKYRTWNGSTWSSEQSGPNGGNAPIHTIQAVPGVGESDILLTWMMDNGQIRGAIWNGTSMTTLGAVAMGAGNKLYESFMAATAQGSGASAQILSWAPAEP